MVKKAESLKSIDELNMSKEAKTYLKGKFDSIDELVWFGRSTVPRDLGGTVKRKSKCIDLMGALDEAGYIRHDINDDSFRIARLYYCIYHDTINVAAMPRCIEDFREPIEERVRNGKTIYHIDYCMANKKYESFENPTSEQLDAVRSSLQACLSKREYEVITYRMGLEDGNNYRTLEQTGQRFCVTRERIRQIEAGALRKLKHNRNTFPKIVSSSDEQRAEIIAIIEEIEELRKDPVFKKEAELRQKLRKISKMPFECAEEAAKYLDGGILDFSDIDRLGLSTRAYNCLKRAGINTVADIIKLPKEDWPKVRNLGRHAIEEVEEKVRAAGYVGFSANDLS